MDLSKLSVDEVRDMLPDTLNWRFTELSDEDLNTLIRNWQRYNASVGAYLRVLIDERVRRAKES